MHRRRRSVLRRVRGPTKLIRTPGGRRRQEFLRSTTLPSREKSQARTEIKTFRVGIRKSRSGQQATSARWRGSAREALRPAELAASIEANLQALWIGKRCATYGRHVRKILIFIPQADAIAPAQPAVTLATFPGGEARHVHNRMDYIGPDFRVHRQQDRK